jgi:hypothetical protein
MQGFLQSLMRQAQRWTRERGGCRCQTRSAQPQAFRRLRQWLTRLNWPQLC